MTDKKSPLPYWQRGFYAIGNYLMGSPASFLALISRRASR